MWTFCWKVALNSWWTDLQMWVYKCPPPPLITAFQCFFPCTESHLTTLPKEWFSFHLKANRLFIYWNEFLKIAYMFLSDPKWRGSLYSLYGELWLAVATWPKGVFFWGGDFSFVILWKPPFPKYLPSALWFFLRYQVQHRWNTKLE